MQKFTNNGAEGEVPDVVIGRMPIYLRALIRLNSQNIEVVSSREFGALLDITPAQIRKDLSYFGRFGKQGKGYSVQHLSSAIREVLGVGPGRQCPVALVGVGSLGLALLGYPNFGLEGFQIVEAFDVDPRQIGRTIEGLTIRPIHQLNQALSESGVKIAIVAVPGTQAQQVVDQLVGAGIKAVLNYAPYSPRVPDGVRVSNIDPVLSLQAMAYFVKGDLK
jgi:redox-sensing transcriptional repressor